MSLVYAVSTDHRLSLALAFTNWLDLSTPVSLLGLCVLRRTIIIMFRIPFFNRKQRGGRAFFFSAAQVWNSLPFAFRHCNSLLAFKTSLKTYLFKQYFDQQ